MNVFEKVTESPEALASLLRALPAIETPWDDAFHRLYCSSRSGRRIATTAAARSGTIRYGGSASRRRR